MFLENVCPDIIYMRFVKEGKVVRVARMDVHKGLVLALYPSSETGILYREAVSHIDDLSPKREIDIKEIRDDIWKKLLSGKPLEEITKNYESAITEGEYYFSKNKNSSIRRVFSISERDEITPNPKPS